MARSKDGSPRRSRGFIAGGVVVAALVVAGIGVSLGAALRPGSSAGYVAPTSGSATRSAPGGSVCGLAGMDRAGATRTVAPAATWQTVGLMGAPTSGSAGPGRRQADGLRSCYAHTVTGALFAIANLWAMGSDPRLYRQVVQEDVAAGAGRTRALALTGTADNTGESGQIAGFKIISYTPAEASVEISFSTSSGQLIGFPAPLQWQDGDWKLELAADGSPVFRPVILSSLEGFTPWAAAQ